MSGMDAISEAPGDFVLFVGDVAGPEQYVAFFGDDGQAGNLYVSDRRAGQIIRHLQIYQQSPNLGLTENDIQVVWSDDGSKCGVVIWGKMRGILDIATGRQISDPLGRGAPGIVDPAWLRGFEHVHLDEQTFIRSRQRYWKSKVKPPEGETSETVHDDTAQVATNFIAYAFGLARICGVFEDDGDTGYLYLYKPEGEKVLLHVHIYDRSRSVDVLRSDVRVSWNNDGTKCGVMVWGKMRGIIDLRNKREGRAWMEGRETPGISDPGWLDGFDAA